MNGEVHPDPVDAAVAEALARWAATDAEIGRSAELETLRRHKEEADRMIAQLAERAAWFESECRRLEVEYHELEDEHRRLTDRCEAMEQDLADARANLTRVLTAMSRKARSAFGRERP